MLLLPFRSSKNTAQKCGVFAANFCQHILERTVKSIFSLVLFGASKFLHCSVTSTYSPLSVCLTKLSEEIIIIGRDDVVGFPLYYTQYDKYFYVCVILDLFSRKVVAHRVSPKNSTYLVTSTFRQAYRNRNEPRQLMFHSDQGPQYTSNTFRKLLRMNKVVQSFSKSGRPHDNAVAESFFASMKRQEIYRTQYHSERQFMRSVDTYIEFYNTKRPHSTLNYKTPDGLELLHAQRRERTG